MPKTQEQIADQCRVVAHLARQIALVHEDKAQVYGEIAMQPSSIDYVGNNTARLMEILGDILKGMDAVDDKEDAWTYPIFKEAQATWPQPREAQPNPLAFRSESA